MRKRHRYVTVIVNADTNKTLAMIEHRNSAALTAFLMSQPHRWRRGVKVVVTDGSRAYKASVDACLPHARHVLDRFHVIRWFCAGLTAVRRDINGPEGSKPAFDPEVGTVRAATPRRHTHRRRPGPPRHPLRHPPEAAGRLASTPRTPRPLPRRRPRRRPRSRPVRDLYQTGELPEFHAIVDTIIAWSDQILAWHHTNHPSNGRIEGTNNLLQVLRRTAHAPTPPTSKPEDSC